MALLQSKHDEAQRKADELLGALNVLREAAGMAPLPARATATGSSATITQIRSDTFYGKRQQTAIREFLEMRKAQNLGPAKPREIYEALKAGGYQFEAKDDETAMIGLRALLRKRTNFFHKMADGSYGLTVWYPHAKKSKTAGGAENETDDDTDDETASAAPDEDAADD